MLSNNSTSSIQRRRQQHRRQQSLEVPIIATPIPVNPTKRALQSRSAHRRGLSLDQSLSAPRSPSGFRPLLPQNGPQQRQKLQSPSQQMVSVQETNIGQPQQMVQQQVQETQQQMPIGQPGYLAQDFRHLQQQQNNGRFNSQPQIRPHHQLQQHSGSPTLQPMANLQQQPTHQGFAAADFQGHLQHQIQGGTSQSQPQLQIPQSPSRQSLLNPEQAAEELQKHIEWFKKTYGSSPQVNIDLEQKPSTPIVQVGQHDAPAVEIPQQQCFNSFSSYAPSMPQTPLSNSYARTVPNTPQTFKQNWPSPPPSKAKHARSQSYQFDCAPMDNVNAINGSFDTTPLFRNQGGAIGEAFFDEVFAGASDHDYASSAYTSSVVDPSSPGPQHHHTPMPTLFEEATTPNGHMHAHATCADDSHLLLQATAGAVHHELDPYAFMGMLDPMDDRQAALDSMQIDASINETGISAEEVQQYISEQDPVDNKTPWTCLFPGCGKKFGRKENIRSHVQTHLGDRQFKCNVCNKCFVRQHDLKRHAKIHTGERENQCPCGQSFARADALTRHRQRGMCTGTLPGFERKEGAAPKRGRPKKNGGSRPGLQERTSKAAKARQLDAELDAAEAALADFYQASSVSGSESGPITPPDSSSFGSDDHILDNMLDFGNAGSWQHVTPPTSPLSGDDAATVKTVSPAALEMGPGGALDDHHSLSFEDEVGGYLSDWLSQ
ncbi:hypothetical protein K431DRAFT_343985 [Polychaeton citri CBS 116435]|uniref:C2H2-type domain-containing protein n=1 Tax=Polychaeton citri CBS 116435 TaxID=1314669 RepID=A0A9P4USZ5_9PEZI|nr:hypothetical protein K431DRAFT_343985 [Polychaeton citri CBS 116435]